MKLYNFDFSKKIFYHPEQIVAYKKRQRPFPVTIEIDLTNKCNHKCSFCFYAEHISNDRSTLDINVLQQTIAKASKIGTKGISFTGGGEPMLHPDFAKISKFTKSQGIDCGLITNGSLIEKYQEVLIDNFTWIRISLAGGDEEAYYKVQGVRQFGKIISNIQSLSELKKAKNSNLNIGIRVLVTPQNINSLRHLAHLLKETEINYIQFAPDMFTSDDGLFWNQASTKDIFNEVETILAHTRIMLLTAGYLQHQNNLAYCQDCYAHYFQIAITAEGNVLYCKNSRGESEFIIGNINQATIEQIWDSQKNKSLESYIKPSNCGLLCKCMQLNVGMEDVLYPDINLSPNFVT